MIQPPISMCRPGLEKHPQEKQYDNDRPDYSSVRELGHGILQTTGNLEACRVDRFDLSQLGNRLIWRKAGLTKLDNLSR